MSEYVIQIEDRSGRLSVVPIENFPFTIGRDPENHLVVPEASISRRHAELRRVPEGLAVVDHKSRNGVYVNKERVVDSRVLKVGDTLRIGSSKFKLLSSRDLDLPTGGRGTETITFVPSRETWDPTRPTASALPQGGVSSLPQAVVSALPQVAASARAPSNLKWLVQLFLDAPVPEVYENILNTVQEAVPFDRCYLILFDESPAPGGAEKVGEPRILAMRDQTRNPSQPIISRDILGRVARGREAVIVATETQPWKPTESFIRSGAASAICVPLLVAGRVIGVIYLDRLASLNILTREDIEVLGPLAGVIGLKVENLRLMNLRIAVELNEKELELAKSIQEGLLPQEKVSLPGWTVEGHSSPCYQVGGDYFDFIPAGPESLFLLIGDISGKGLPSALYMAGVRSTLRAHLEDRLDLNVVMARLEKQVLASFRPDHFLTLVVGRLEASTGRLTYSNAGHYPPVLLSASGEVSELEVTDPALNVFPCGEYHTAECVLQPGDTLLLYTDGLTDEVDGSGQRFGKDRLVDSMRRLADQDLETIRKRIFADIDDFAAPDSTGDDKTIILLRREKA